MVLLTKEGYCRHHHAFGHQALFYGKCMSMLVSDGTCATLFKNAFALVKWTYVPIKIHTPGGQRKITTKKWSVVCMFWNKNMRRGVHSLSPFLGCFHHYPPVQNLFIKKRTSFKPGGSSYSMYTNLPKFWITWWAIKHRSGSPFHIICRQNDRNTQLE